MITFNHITSYQFLLSPLSFIEYNVLQYAMGQTVIMTFQIILLSIDKFKIYLGCHVESTHIIYTHIQLYKEKGVVSPPYF